MTHTPTPWYTSHDRNGYDHIQSAAIDEDNYVAGVDSFDAQGNANAVLIVRAVNSHDALVSALVDALTNLRSRNHPTEFDLECIEAGDKALALAESSNGN